MPTVAVALVALTSSQPAWAQSESRITGVVRDATGAVVPGATVTATNQTTRDSKTATTGADGSYSISVPPATYSVAVSLTGFRRTAQDVEVSAGASKQLDFSLETQLTEEVTVTATKREQTILDVPFSVAAPTEEMLRARGVEDIEGVAANVVGLTVQNLGPGQSQVAMRGVSAGQIVRDQPGVKEQVGVYLDESVISLSLFTPDLDLFDTKRVEVLRGPQGTLFGSGSLTGTVRYITNQPELSVTKGFAELGLSGVDGGSAGGNAKFGFNVPLGDKAALRVASYYDRIAGYIDTVQPDLTANDDVNDGFRTGLRAAARIAPSPRLSITPRLVYQRVGMDGWNRIDDFNILANPFTTTRPAVTLGGRTQFTQLEEKFTDDFVLGDVNIEYNFGDLLLTSITSYTYRDILVIRDAGALTSSITGGTIGLDESVYTLDAPLDDATKAQVWTQELRVAGGKDRYPWVAGGFFSRTDRDYGQNLLVAGFEDLSGIPTRGLRAPKDTLFFSDLGYKLESVRPVRRSERVPDRAVQPDGRPPLLPLQRGQGADLRRHLRAGQHRHVARVAARLDRRERRRAAPDRDLQAVGLRTRERAGLAGIPARRNQRPAQRAAVHAAGSRHVRRAGDLGRREGLELRGGLQVQSAERQRCVQRGRVLHGHPTTCRQPSPPAPAPHASSSTCRRRGPKGSRSSSRRRPTATSILRFPQPSTIPSCVRRSRRPTRAAL